MLFRSHPLPEVASLAEQALKQLLETYPNSFREVARDSGYSYMPEFAILNMHYDMIEAYRLDYHYKYSMVPITHVQSIYDGAELNYVDRKSLIQNVLQFRKKGSAIPEHIIPVKFHINAQIDFASWRDIQRHRKCNPLQPLLKARTNNPEEFINSWYIGSLQTLLSEEDYSYLLLLCDVGLQKTLLAQDTYRTDFDQIQLQYLMPMGINCHCVFTMSAAEAVYIAELRTGPTVHPTARIFAQTIAKAFDDLMLNLKLSPTVESKFIENDDDSKWIPEPAKFCYWDSSTNTSIPFEKRGGQTILKDGKPLDQ